MQENKNLTFGPVNSRRFGISLGIDLSPSFKQCNFDCLYCELAPTPTMSKQTHSINVKEYIDAVKIALEKNPEIEVITLTANGEPTLYPELSKLIDEYPTSRFSDIARKIREDAIKEISIKEEVIGKKE